MVSGVSQERLEILQQNLMHRILRTRKKDNMGKRTSTSRRWSGKLVRSKNKAIKYKKVSTRSYHLVETNRDTFDAINASVAPL
jgi:hypothetical protein